MRISLGTDLAARKRRGWVGWSVFGVFTIVFSPHSLATNPIGTILFAVVGGAFVGLLTAIWPTTLFELLQADRRPADPGLDIRRIEERYKAVLRSTLPADRTAAEVAVAILCRDGGLGSMPCVWVRSPREAILAKLALGAYAAAIADPRVDPRTAWDVSRGACPPGADTLTWHGVVESLETELGAPQPLPVPLAEALASILSDPSAPSREQVAGIVGARFWGLESMVRQQRAAIASALADDGFTLVDVDDASGLPRDVHLLAATEYLGILPMTSHGRRVMAMTRLLESCGGWWTTPIAVVLTERPLGARHDVPGAVLHAVDGPALLYADGWRIYAEHGVTMPRAAFEAPDTITVDAIHAEPNPNRRRRLVRAFGEGHYLEEISASAALIVAEPDVATRRAAIERFGVVRFVEETGSVIDSDLDRQGQMRRLWRTPRPGDTAIALVEVVNSTPEGDGSRHHYWLRVPPHLTRCQDAVAWTFGIEPAEYEPALES